MTLSDFESEQYLKPVIDDDALILLLDDLILDGPAEAPDVVTASRSDDHKSLAEVNSTLAHELETLKSQFSSYRLAVEETLDKRWGEDVSTSGPSQRPKDPSQYYWESYAANGTHRMPVTI